MQVATAKTKESSTSREVHPSIEIATANLLRVAHKPTILIVHNRPIVRHGLSLLIKSFPDFVLIGHAASATSTIEKLKSSSPDIVIIDNDLTVSEVYKIARWIKDNKRNIKVLIIGTVEEEPACLRLISEGVDGLVSKHANVGELYQALKSLLVRGFYGGSSDFGIYIKLSESDSGKYLSKRMLTDQEIQFLQQAASDKTYKEIAVYLGMHVRSIDNIRDRMFVKFGVKNRVGLVMLAIKEGIVPI